MATKKAIQGNMVHLKNDTILKRVTLVTSITWWFLKVRLLSVRSYTPSLARNWHLGCTFVSECYCRFATRNMADQTYYAQNLDQSGKHATHVPV